MEKKFTISYKVYPNERLKPVSFHEKEVYPLYIQLIYNRKPIYFKSYFFNLLSSEKYVLYTDAGKKYPEQKVIIAKEESVLEYVIKQAKKNTETITAEVLQESYYRYSKDLLSILDDGFKDYVHVFFVDEGQIQLAMYTEAVREKTTGSKMIAAYKSALKPQLFKKILENAPYYGPPYLPVYNFLEQLNSAVFPTFSVYQWESYQSELQTFLTKEYPDYSFKEMQSHMQKIISLT